MTFTTKALRALTHLSAPAWLLRRRLGPTFDRSVEAAIRDSESKHRGELVFAVEESLRIPALIRGTHPEERAREVFSILRVWDTTENNGVLIYMLLADRDVEIVADRGVNSRVPPGTWEDICRLMESAFREGRFEEGSAAGIAAIGAILTREYPASGANPNELPDALIRM
ncbi:MAG: hypothetical protein FJ224_03590 [Lentisphaerae bacterium]|nr:hypothetical protein [Lentisphaerota bacterium]